MDSEIFEDAKDWEEIAQKSLINSEDKETVKENKAAYVHGQKNEIKNLHEQVKRLEQRNQELHCDNRYLKRCLDDAEAKFRYERKRYQDKEKHDKFVFEVRERIKIEETERERVRCELKKRREDEKEYLEFQEFKRRKK